jgi:hypothetical protein
MSHEELIANHSHCLSRRRFVASAGVLTAAAWFSPRHLFAEGENIVLAARKRAETTDISVQTLRGNVNMHSSAPAETSPSSTERMENW